MPESSYGILSDKHEEAVGCIGLCNDLFCAVEAAEAITQGNPTDISKELVKILPDPDGDTDWCHCCDLYDYTFIVSTEFVPSEVPEAVRHSMGMVACAPVHLTCVKVKHPLTYLTSFVLCCVCACAPYMFFINT